jgi:UDPglucose 6-dehydrogenase
MTQPVIGFVGMTHLGLVSGVSATEKGFTLVCFDPDASRIAALQRGELPVSEPQLDELVRKNADRLCFTANPTDLKSCDVIYVAPDVATDDQGRSDLSAINSLFDTVLDAARTDAVLVVLSQVPPGFTRGKQRTGRLLYYQVETLIFGRAVERALYPERYIIGCADPAKPLPPAFQIFLDAHGCPILPMRFESAELAKISINMCLVASVSTANTLAELCEKIGADWSEIVPALKLDRRIGAFSYLNPGLGLSGGNLERDLFTYLSLSERFKTDAGTVNAWIANSNRRKRWAESVLRERLARASNTSTIAIWGLAYKEDTSSTKTSAAILTLANVQDLQVRIYDPVVRWDQSWHPNAKIFNCPMETLEGAEALLIMTPWNKFREISLESIAQRLQGSIIIDPFGIIQSYPAPSRPLELHALGRSTQFFCPH